MEFEVDSLGNKKELLSYSRKAGTGVLAVARRLTLLSPPAPELSPVRRDRSYLGPKAPLTTEVPPSCIISAARAV